MPSVTSRRSHAGGLVPLSASPARHRRLFHGVSLLRLAARSGVSLRKLSLAERGLRKLSRDEERRRDQALQRLAESGLMNKSDDDAGRSDLVAPGDEG